MGLAGQRILFIILCINLTYKNHKRFWRLILYSDSLCSISQFLILDLFRRYLSIRSYKLSSRKASRCCIYIRFLLLNLFLWSPGAILLHIWSLRKLACPFIVSLIFLKLSFSRGWLSKRRLFVKRRNICLMGVHSI